MILIDLQATEENKVDEEKKYEENKVEEKTENIKRIASVNENDIRAFRAKYYEKPVDELDDLNPKSDDVIAIQEKIKALEGKAFDMINIGEFYLLNFNCRQFC